MRIHQKIDRRASEQLEEYGLTLAQFEVLAKLSAGEGISQQALAERLFVTKGNVCGLLDRMAAKGLVQRHADPDDRRANLLYLTDAGKELAQQIVPLHEALIVEQMGVLNADEQRFLQMLLRRLDRSLEPG
jgi:DNA-binding MarR family transcriptional regulator